MNWNHPTIAIIGAGAVGGYYGARLVQHGHDVHFLLRSDFEIVRSQGLIIRSIDGDFDLPAAKLRIYQNPAEMPTVDLVIIALKTTANAQFAHLIAPLLRDDTAILTLQNGLGNEEELAGLFGAARILGGLAFTCINRVGPGLIHHLDHGLIRLGEFVAPSNSDRAIAIAQLFQNSRIHCQVLDDLCLGRWEKLIWNAPFNGLGAALDLNTQQLLANSDGERLVCCVMREVLDIACVKNLRFPAAIIEQKISQTRTMGAYMTSMQIDRRHGRPMETEAILGQALQVAREINVSTPFLAVVYRMLRAIPVR